MKKSLVLAVSSLAIIFSMLAVAVAEPAFAMSVTEGVNAARGDQQPAVLFGDTGIFTTISNVLLFIVGAIAVISTPNES